MGEEEWRFLPSLIQMMDEPSEIFLEDGLTGRNEDDFLVGLCQGGQHLRKTTSMCAVLVLMMLKMLY